MYAGLAVGVRSQDDCDADPDGTDIKVDAMRRSDGRQTKAGASQRMSKRRALHLHVEEVAPNLASGAVERHIARVRSCAQRHFTAGQGSR